MNSNTIEIPTQVIDFSNDFRECEQATDQFIFPLLRELEAKKSDQIYALLVDVIIEGNDISKRLQVYCGVGKIHMREARKIANMIDDQIADLGIVLKFLKKQSGADDIRKYLTTQKDTGIVLADALRRMIHVYMSDTLSGKKDS